MHRCKTQYERTGSQQSAMTAAISSGQSSGICGRRPANVCGHKIQYRPYARHAATSTREQRSRGRGYAPNTDSGKSTFCHFVQEVEDRVEIALVERVAPVVAVRSMSEHWLVASRQAAAQQLLLQQQPPSNSSRAAAAPSPPHSTHRVQRAHIMMP